MERHRGFARLASRLEAPATAAGCAVLIAAATHVLGVPDPGLVREFAAGGRPPDEAALATASLLVWTALLGVCGWLLLGACRCLPAALVRRRGARLDTGTVILVAGITLFVVGLAHHTESALQLCCGSIKEASQSLAH